MVLINKMNETCFDIFSNVDILHCANVHKDHDFDQKAN